MSKQSWGQRNHIDEGVELVGFSKLPSEREWETLMRDRSWILEHQDILHLLPDRDRSIIELRFGVPDGPIHTLGAVATVCELGTGLVTDRVSYALGDLRRIVRSGLDQGS